MNDNDEKQLASTGIFTQCKSGDPSPADIRLAAAILMFEVVKADQRIDRLEVSELIEILRTQFNMSTDEVGALLEDVGVLGNQLIQVDSFTLRIRELWNVEQRLQLLKNFWTIAAADNDIDQREIQFIEKIAGTLNLDQESIEKVQLEAELSL